MSTNIIRNLIIPALLMLTWGVARADEEFDPANPPEPQATYKLTVNATPQGVATVSGTGRYSQEQRVYVNTSLIDTDYAFKHWLLDAEVYSTSRSFYYTMPDHAVTLTAVYEFVPFDPANPADPGSDYKWRLNLVGTPAEACSFNINSGNKYTQGSSVTVRAYTNQGFDFEGWYVNDQLVSESVQFNYVMPSNESTLEARFVFNPDSPGDPSPNYLGDINGDCVLTNADVLMLVAKLHGDNPANFNQEAADMNHDSTLTSSDLLMLVGRILK